MRRYRIVTVPKATKLYWVLENNTRPVRGGKMVYAGPWIDCVNYLKSKGW